ncbi:hypothetical protein IGI04_030133 [Brassica rapa subsp. trilocularis]|uniref:Uncharacterized protein n=1 Tax=Brassica rapa subsp. trilocularis TaxID=1813537 RepID=A0ABQ7LPT7_BRACM|nr:hypothetical protein IGI04_030133 [Brassica rapa subsp. trilocularis]
MRRRLPDGERMVAGCGGSGERPAEMVAREIHARIFLLRVWARRGGCPVETPAPDSSRRHEHTGGLEIARNPMVREISTIY